MKKIEEMFAFVAVDEDGEGVVAMQMAMPNGAVTFMPLVAADKARVESLKPHAREIAEASGKKVRLVKFSVREELEW